MRLFRLSLALFAVPLLTATAPAQQAKPAAKAPQARDWRTHVVQTKSGAILTGNPAAKVRLVEYLSYTCPHCAHFVAESKAPLHDDLVRRGQVRVEFRHAVRDPLDMAASLLARCTGPKGFSGATQAIFAAQESWFEQGKTWWQANGARIQEQPELARIKAAASGSGLSALMQKRGMSAGAIDRCFAAPGDLDKLTAMTKAAWAVIQGTPSFTVNGKAVAGSDWAALQPELRAAGAR
ncbi:DsbA family protein [Sphingomonas sp.]|uniref:DsbA family protein n=1 Tax=Sphingomonas sp. TaxID=28214 RepID=UPI002ED9E0E2